VERALDILETEAFDALGLLGARSLDELGPDLLVPASRPVFTETQRA
jgi:hypothetical protein